MSPAVSAASNAARLSIRQRKASSRLARLTAWKSGGTPISTVVPRLTSRCSRTGAPAAPTRNITTGSPAARGLGRRSHHSASDEAAVVLHRQEQLAWHHVALGGAPDVATHRLASGELVVSADEADVDRRRRR